MPRGRIAARIGGIESVDVGEQHERIGADHLRHARGEPVVVAEADFLGRDRVVLVDDRHRAERQQLLERCARIEMAAALFGVVGREQDLRDRDAVLAERLLIGVREADLPEAAAACFSSSFKLAAGQAEMPAADRDRAGGDDRAPPGRGHGSARCPRPAPRARRGGCRRSASSTSSAEPILTMSRARVARLSLIG